ncbi:MAG TPA: TolC family protein [Vicinamibacterales bacterium]|jgi:outer membrane protein TolC
MKSNGLKCLITCATVVLATASNAAAQKITDQRIADLIREAALRAGVETTAATALPTAQSAAGQGDRPTVRLSLDDTIKLALDRNLDISVQRLNPQTFDFSLASLRSVYRPTLTSAIGSSSNVQIPQNQSQGGIPAGQKGITAGTAIYNGGLGQTLPWGGGTLAVTLNHQKGTTDSTISTINPSFVTTYQAQVTQPLLRNFKIDNTRQQIVVTKLNQDISEIQLQATIINTLSNVRNAYWDYVFAVQSVEVARRSVALADQLVNDNRTRVEVGTMAPIDVIQAQSQAATQRQNLAIAEGTRRTNELSLKRLIVSGTDDPNWSATIDPLDRPGFEAVTVDLTAAVRRALDVRTDLAQVRKNLEVNNVTLKYLKNQTMPQADLVARYGVQGRGGTFITRAPGFGGAVLSTTPGGFVDAFSTMFANDFPTWNVQVNVTYPIGTSTQEASYARARLQSNQVEAQLKQIELQIATDVTNAATNVQNNIERVQAAQAAREFAQKQYEAEQSKFEVGMSTNYFVVQSQRDLATAQNNELSAILAYRRSVVELERLQQTSTSSANITILGR